MKFRKKRGKLADVRLTLEVSLYKNGIERPVYHGGDLTGVMVKKLFQNIDVVLDYFKTIIMNVNDRSADDREVELICERYNQLGFLFDAVFSIARTQSGRLTNNMKYDTRRYVKAALATWRSLRLSMLGPKVHAIEDHLVSSMEEWHGIGDFIEDFVEKGHQQYLKDCDRTSRLKNKQLIQNAHNRYEQRRQQKMVIKAQEMIKEATSRKRKRGVEERKHNKKVSREDKRLQALLEVESLVDENKYETIDDYNLKGVVVQNDDGIIDVNDDSDNGDSEE